ncbi:MAG: DUF2157 domain-containing protein [Planctomycetota bacterium]|nr:DUF2157 domain-containing protein [Planctomycetota bacterium]
MTTPLDRQSLLRALEELRSEELLDDESQAAVREKLLPLLAKPSESHASAKPEATTRPNILVAFLTTMGAILIGAGLISFAAVNWDGMHRFTRLAWIGGGLLLLQGGGRAVAGRAPLAGNALCAAGVLATGAAIGLISEIYQIQAETPVAMLFIWWAVNLPVLVLVRSSLVALIMSGLFAAWWLAWTGDYLQGLPGGADLGPGGSSGDESVGFLTAGFLGALLVALGYRFGRGNQSQAGVGSCAHLAAPLRLVGFLLALVPAFALGFEDWAGHHGGDLALALWLPAALTAGLAFILLALPGAGVRPLPALLLFINAVLLLGQQYLPADVHYLGNALMLVALPALVALGVRYRDTLPINLSVGWFLIVVIARFFEHLSNNLGGSLAFIGSGLVFMFLGLFLERNRRRWVASALGEGL